MTYTFPKDFFYADTHEYVKKENGFLKIGISEFAVDQLGDIVFVDLPDVGTSFERGNSFGSVESVKAVEDMYLPISGEVLERNEQVIDNPEDLQNDPHGKGWLLLIKPKDLSHLDSMMDASAYGAKIAPN